MLEQKIESILFFRNEPVTVTELAEILNVSKEEIKFALEKLQELYRERGIVIISNGDDYSLGTNPQNSELIENLVKEELSRELGRAGLETLSLVLYRGPVSRREIDHIRGVNSGFILRNLLIRGLIERVDPSTVLPRQDSGQVGAGRSYSYKPTLKLIEYLGLSRREDLPEYANAFKKLDEFVKERKLDPLDSLEVNHDA